MLTQWFALEQLAFRRRSQRRHQHVRQLVVFRTMSLPGRVSTTMVSEVRSPRCYRTRRWCWRIQLADSYRSAFPIAFHDGRQRQVFTRISLQ